MNKILVLCDFSKKTLPALDIAVQIAEKKDGSVVLLHVLNFPSIGELMNDFSHIENWQDL
jgi:nucleotide-binding universal stress UspA family protein